MYQRSLQKSQGGFVSLFTVIFFMLLITVITVGFLRIMAIEQRQSLDNDLSASALAAAESGIEDGKRALLAYYNPATPGALRSDLSAAFANGACDSLTSVSSIQSQIGINGQAVGGTGLNQSYTCLNVKLDSPDYLGQSQASKSEILPLRAGTSYDQIKISWHLLSASVGSEGDGQPANLAPTVPVSLLPQIGGSQSWASEGYPSYLRVQLFGNPTGSFTRSDLNDRSRSVFLVPSDSGGAGAIDLGAADPSHNFDTAKSSPNTAAECGNNFTLYGTYLCTATLTLPSGAQYTSANNNYYLRITPLYGPAHFRVQLLNSSTGDTVDLRGVQPLIDATGKAEDVYRRLQVRVRLNPTTGLPEYAAESADTICKNMQVADGSPGSWRLNDCP